jgi:hypothetical protein
MDDLLRKYCLYLIDDERDSDLLETIKNEAKDDFPKYQKKARSYVHKLKEFALKYNTDIDFTSFYNLLQKYIEEKDNMNDDEKKSYLLLMRLLADIHNIDLKKELASYVSEKNTTEVLNEIIDTEIESSYLMNTLSNPLDNDTFLKSLLFQRYNNGSFEVREISLPGEKRPDDEEEFDESIMYQKQAELMIHLYSIFIDKMNNYALDDLNPYFVKLIGDGDLNRLSELNESDLLEFITNDNQDEVKTRLNLSDSLYTFISESLKTTNYQTEHIGEEGTLNLFHTPHSDSHYTIRIYLNSPARNDIYDFLNYYINKCVEENINYNMKGIWNTWDGSVLKDRTILYADTKDIDDKIAILEEIREVYPETVAAFGAPICGCARINDSYYGISHAGFLLPNVMSCLQTYNDYFNSVCEVAYYRTLAKLIINLKELDGYDKTLIQALINLDENEIGFISNIESAVLMTISNHPFGTIKDCINKYMPNIVDTLDYYFNNDEHMTTLSEEFKKSILYISNILQKREKRTKSNIAVSSYMEANLPKEMSNQFNI